LIDELWPDEPPPSAAKIVQAHVSRHVGEGAIWVAARPGFRCCPPETVGTGTLTRIDPTTNSVEATIPIGGNPAGVAVGEGAVWIADPGTRSVVRADPIVLDAALSADPSASRVVNQMLEGLVELAPGRTTVIPKLATSWKTSKDGRTWTFFLRRRVKFHDGTPLNAAAVCFNFERWYGFAGSLQGATYFWPIIFGGFRKPEPGSPGPVKSLYRSCQRVDDLTVRLRLARRTTSFLAALAYPSFGIASPTALRKYDADAGEADANGTFHPAGTYGTAHPTGTGPFMFRSWRPGREIVLVRNPRYWGKKAKLDRLVFRTIIDRTGRLHALERGTIQGLDAVLVGAADTIRRNPRLKLLDRPSGNVGYVGINQAIPPMNKLLVRQAVAYGLGRARRVRSTAVAANSPTSSCHRFSWGT